MALAKYSQCPCRRSKRKLANGSAGVCGGKFQRVTVILLQKTFDGLGFVVRRSRIRSDPACQFGDAGIEIGKLQITDRDALWIVGACSAECHGIRRHDIRHAPIRIRGMTAIEIQVGLRAVLCDLAEVAFEFHRTLSKEQHVTQGGFHQDAVRHHGASCGRPWDAREIRIGCQGLVRDIVAALRASSWLFM